MKKVFLLILALGLAFLGWSQSSDDALIIQSGDTRIVRNRDGSFDFFIRKKPGMESILITDSTADPDEETDSFSLRAYESHPSYGKERRFLNGNYIDNEERIKQGLEPLYFLMDSEASSVRGFDPETEWFHIYVPSSVIFGYPWSREGQFDVGVNTWLNIRAFPLKNADYTQGFKDNPFIISRKLPDVPLAPREKPFRELAMATRGKFFNPKNGEEMLSAIDKILDENKDDNLDIVLVIDSTISMKDKMSYLRKDLVDLLTEQVTVKNPGRQVRIGMVLYRDYPPDQYLTREIAFTKDLSAVQMNLNKIVVNGGRDIPEAVYEGIDAGLSKMDWQGQRKIIIQVGDAIPHPVPKGLINQQTVVQKAKESNVSVYTILLPERIPLRKD